jgi:hypothetical protein
MASQPEGIAESIFPITAAITGAFGDPGAAVRLYPSAGGQRTKPLAR